MGRQPCCDKVGLKRGPWTIEEDQKLMNFIINNGIQCWRLVPKLAGLLRCGKSCRLRWMNYLRPDLKRGAFSSEEEDQIIQLHSRLGNRWSKIASHFPGRTDNEIKNHWNTKIKKKLKLQGLDPQTHQPIQDSDAKENTLQLEHSKEASGSDIELKQPDVPSFRNYHNEDCNQDQQKSESGEKSEPNSSGIDETVLQVDCGQLWMNNVDSLLSYWDGFSNLEDIFSLFD